MGVSHGLSPAHPSDFHRNLLQTHGLSTSCGVGWPGAPQCWDSFLAVLPCHISLSPHQSHPGWGQEILCDPLWCHGNDPHPSEHISGFCLEGPARGVLEECGGGVQGVNFLLVFLNFSRASLPGVAQSWQVPPGYAVLVFSGSFISKIRVSVGFGGEGLRVEHGAFCLCL